MGVVENCIFMIVLVLSDIPSSIRIIASRSTCNHPWKEDFGFKNNETVGVLVKNLPEVSKGFLDVINQDSLEEGLKMPLTTCIKSLDCRLYTLLDKNDTDSLTFCVVTRETRACTAFTCTCPNERNPRSIETNQFTRNSTSILGITKPICKFKSILDEKMFDITQTKFTNTENCSDKNMVEYTTTMGIPFKYNCMELKVGIGTVFGGLATFIWFKRRYLQPKTSPAVTEIYNRETARMSIHDVTEYSEIPECSIKTHSEETDIVKYQEDIMECPVGVDALNHSSKEEIKPIMDAAHGDINKISVYFELRAVSESEKLFASECTDSVIKEQCKHVERSTVETKHFNTERNAASVCKNGDDNPKDIVYFELSKATI